ncbi:MAG: S49 family peptidase [Chlamydiales bacterium]
MKIIHESVFMSAFRAFFIAFFGVLGTVISLLGIFLASYLVFKSNDDQTFSANVEILPDGDGNRKKLSGDSPILLQITIEGEIGKDKLTGKKIEEILIKSREEAFSNNRVKGILLVINSPGGGVNDSNIIYRHLKEYKTKYHVPIYTFIDGLCTSGGYYIACASDKIFASEVSVIGSIGVLNWPPFMNFTDTMKKIGIESMTLSAGKGKDQMNPFRPWHEGEEEDYQSLIDYFYQQFTTIVTLNRPIDMNNLKDNIGAKVLTPPQAKDHGFIDESNASRREVLNALAKEVGIEDHYQVVGFESTSWLKKVIKETPCSPIVSGKIKHEFSLPISEGNALYWK